MAGPIIEPIINFLKFVIIFFGRNNNRAGIFFDIILKQRRHSRQNVHSDDSFLGCFRPSHAGRHHHSMGGKGPPVHEFVGLYSDPQCDAGTITAVVRPYICVLQIKPTSEVSQTVLHVSQTVLRWSWQHEWTENVCCQAHTGARTGTVQPHFESHALNVTASGMLKQGAVLMRCRHHTKTSNL